MRRAKYVPEQEKQADGSLGEWYWNLIGANGEPMGSSHPETYTRKADAIRGAKDAKKASRFAKVEK